MEDAVAQLNEDYGSAQATRMRDNATVAFELLATLAEDDREARALLDDLQDKGLHEHPGTVEALNILYKDVKDNPRFRDAWAKRAARQMERQAPTRRAGEPAVETLPSRLGPVVGTRALVGHRR